MSFYLGSGNTLSWEADEDSVLTSAVAWVNSAIVHLDPDMTFSQFANQLLADKVDPAQLIYLGSNTSGLATTIDGLSFQLSKGQKIFVSPQGTVEFVQLFFQQFDDLGIRS